MLVLFILLAIVWFFFLRGISNKDIPKTLIIHDTTVVMRYNDEVKKDTVVKWYEKVIYKEAIPERIYIQKVDSVFVEKAKQMDVMLQVKKDDNKLVIKALDMEGKQLKEYVWEDVGKDFTATSQKGNIFIKSEMLNWNGILIDLVSNNTVGHTINGRFEGLSISAGIGTGITFKDKFSLNTGYRYDGYRKDHLLYLGLSYKLR